MTLQPAKSHLEHRSKVASIRQAWVKFILQKSKDYATLLQPAIQRQTHAFLVDKCRISLLKEYIHYAERKCQRIYAARCIALFTSRMASFWAWKEWMGYRAIRTKGIKSCAHYLDESSLNTWIFYRLTLHCLKENDVGWKMSKWILWKESKCLNLPWDRRGKKGWIVY